MGEHGGVGVGVDEVERPAEDVAELVVQSGARRPEGDAREVGAVEEVAAPADVGGVGHHRRQRAGDRPHRFQRQRRGDRVVAGGVQRLDGVGEGVERAGAGDVGGQADRQQRVVDDGSRQDVRRRARLLVPAAGEPVDRRHLAAGVGRRHGDDRQPVGERDRLGEAGRRAAAEAGDAVGVGGGDGGAGAFGELDGDVLDHLVPAPDDPAAEPAGGLVGEVLGLAVGDEEQPTDVEAIDFGGDLTDPSRAEDHAARM